MDIYDKVEYNRPEELMSVKSRVSMKETWEVRLKGSEKSAAVQQELVISREMINSKLLSRKSMVSGIFNIFIQVITILSFFS